MSLSIVVTNGGLAALAAAQANGTLPLVITKVGVSPTAITPVPTLTALAGETKQITTISGLTTDSKSAHITVQDQTSDDYTVRSFGLYLANGTLFALYGQPDAIIVKTDASVLNLAIDIQFASITAASLSFGDTNFANPDATTVTKGVVELATSAEAVAGTDTVRAVTPSGLWAAFTALLSSFGVWRASNDGAGSGLDADLLDGLEGADYVKKTDAATTAAAGVSALATAAETQAGTVTNKAVTPSGFLSAFTALVAAFQIWRASNDGAGSGLDADLLDGQHGSYYLAASAYTAADVKAKMLTVDGSGSGLDADLLDGQDGAYYANILARLGYTPVQQGGGAGQGTNKIYIGWSGSRVKMQVDSSDMGNVVFDGNISDVWRASTDGSGSGLDADLLDGQDGAYYANVIARLGYTPLNSGSYTAGDILGKMVSVDGSGSGLDADLLDGQDGSYYANVVARLGYTPANAAGQNFGGSLAVGGSPVWFAGNDGAGSGLDADLLDGKDAAAFALAALTSSVLPAGSNGNGTWFKIGNLIIQCGMKSTISPDNPATITYPIALSNAPFFFIAGTRISSFDGGADSFAQIIGTPGTASMTVANQRANNSATIDVPWMIAAWT
ncbi:hypothetical protein MMA231_02491 [Asticcacaulis sp. MM231]|uniref:hypothetical protein n=1 Tax=Asticcacaulis sp. MM231 TaxID=3157666 RepID=UPI0032D570AF